MRYEIAALPLVARNDGRAQPLLSLRGAQRRSNLAFPSNPAVTPLLFLYECGLFVAMGYGYKNGEGLKGALSPFVFIHKGEILMRIYAILLTIILISCSSTVSKEGDDYKRDIDEGQAIKLAYDYFDKHLGLVGNYDVTATKHITPSNLYVNDIENKSVAEHFYHALEGKRYWAVCFFSEDVKDKVQKLCPVVIFLDASTGEYLTTLVTFK